MKYYSYFSIFNTSPSKVLSLNKIYNVKKWRLEQGLFQVDLAKMIDVSELTIVDWEKGRTKPMKKNLETLRRLLGVESILSPSNDHPNNVAKYQNI